MTLDYLHYNLSQFGGPQPDFGPLVEKKVFRDDDFALGKLVVSLLFWWWRIIAQFGENDSMKIT